MPIQNAPNGSEILRNWAALYGEVQKRAFARAGGAHVLDAWHVLSHP
jgi:hypothetical protein